jgi:hypothetical protein
LGRYEEDTSVKKTELKAMRGNKVATIKSLKEQKERSEFYYKKMDISIMLQMDVSLLPPFPVPVPIP